MLTHRLFPLVPAGTQPHAVPRVVVQHRQRMAASPAHHRNMPLEVHLPQVVGLRLLEPRPRLRCRRGLLGDLSVPVQDRRDRAGRGQLRHAAIRQPLLQLASTPSRMACACFQHALLHRVGRALGRVCWTPRPITQVFSRQRPRQPLVPGLAADTKPTAQLRYRHTARAAHRHKLRSIRHDRHLLPGHARPPFWMPNSSR